METSQNKQLILSTVRGSLTSIQSVGSIGVPVMPPDEMPVRSTLARSTLVSVHTGQVGLMQNRGVQVCVEKVRDGQARESKVRSCQALSGSLRPTSNLWEASRYP